MILSILIPSIPERRSQLVSLTNELYRQILALQTVHPSLGSVELVIDDSKKFTEGGLSIGAKRDALLQRASGEYVCFLDDDDRPTPNYIEQLVRMCNEGNDIVTFRCLVKNDYYWSLIDMKLSTEVNEEVNPNSVIKRTPWHVCPVKREIGLGSGFGDLNHNEDWTWMQSVLYRVKTESHTDMILTQYNHSESGSEADRIVRGETERTKDWWNPVLISLAVNGREDYISKSKNLERSIADFWSFDVRLYKEYPEYCTPNSVIPYKFKYDLIKQARKDGYKQVLWLDSSIRLASGGISLWFPESGVIAFDNLGHPLWKYISDKACANLNIGESELMRIPQTWGGALGFDFSKDKACEVFEEIYEHSLKGSFDTAGSKRKGFVAHRHDQATVSVILWKHKIKLLPYGEIVTAEHAKSGEYGNNYKLIYGDI